MITDRTQADVDAAKTLIEKVQSGKSLTTAEKTAIERGTCTITMLNRVESKQKEVAALLNHYAYMVDIQTKTDWTANDIFTADDHRRLLDNLDKLKRAYYQYSTTPTTPDYMYDYKNANDIEKILVDIESIITDMVSRMRECNTFYCGEVNNL